MHCHDCPGPVYITENIMLMKKHYDKRPELRDSTDSDLPDKYPAWWQNYTTWFIVAIIAIIVAFAIVWI